MGAVAPARAAITAAEDEAMPDATADARVIMERIPCGLFILASAYEDQRTGVLTRWVQPCSFEPPLIMIAVPKGMPVEPLIRDSRHFSLCLISDQDRLLERKFSHPPDRGDDPFVALPARMTPNGMPILERTLGWMECEVVRHIDLEADHRLYVGQILHASLQDSAGYPAVQVDGRLRPPYANGVRT